MPIRVRNSKTSTLPSLCPNKVTSPAVGCISVASNLSKVDLPAPFGPRITHRSPSDKVKEIGPKISLPERVTTTFVKEATCVIGWQDYPKRCPKIAL